MRALLCVLVIVGCAKKADEKQTPEDKAGEQAAKPPSAPPETKPAEAPPEAKSVETPPEAKPAESTANVDCAKLVTAEDVAKACGGSKVDVAEGASGVQAPHTVCSLKVSEPGKRFPAVRVQLMVFPDAARADSWIKLDKIEGSKEVAGVGDLAWTRVKEHAALKATDYDVGVRKGQAVLKLGMTKNSLNKTLPCTPEQLTELAKTVAPRMP